MPAHYQYFFKFVTGQLPVPAMGSAKNGV